MAHDEENLFTHTMMAGLFIGVIDTLICLVFNIGYRNYTGYTPSAIINVSSIIFAVNLLLLLTGMLYFLFIKVFGKRDYIYIAVSILFTLALAWKTELIHRFTDTAVNTEFKGLLLGIVLILGVSAILLPFLSRSRFFDTYVI